MSIFRRGYNEAEWATIVLREQLSEAAPDVADRSAAMGCCGCGAWLCDVVISRPDGNPYGEGYCWRCVDRKRIDEFTVLEGRER